MKTRSVPVWITLSLIGLSAATGALAQDRSPHEYFPTTPGSHWTLWTEIPATPADNRWSFVDAVRDTFFGIEDEVRSFRFEWSERDPVNPDTSTYRVTYYAFDHYGNLGYTAEEWGGTLTVFDSVVVILRNPIEVGDSVYVAGSGYEVSYVVVSVTDTLQTPFGFFENCLRWRERLWFGGELAEVSEELYIPSEYLPQYGGIGRRHSQHGTVESFSRLVSDSGLADVGTPPPRGFTGPISYVRVYPKPVHGEVEIACGLSSPAEVSLQIFNVRGQLVHSLQPSHRNAGSSTLHWPLGTTPSGVYFFRVSAGDSWVVRRAIVAR